MPITRWQNKIRGVRRFLRGWAKNQAGENKKKKQWLLQQLDCLDRKAESTLLSEQEIESKRVLSVELRKLLREEELYWLQRSKATRLLQGDNNTKYFQLLANGRHRKTKIYQLEQDEGTIIGDDNLKDYITNYLVNRKSRRRSLRWNITKPQVRMVSQLNFINSSGRPLKGT